MCPWTEIHTQGGNMSWGTFSNIARYFPMTRGVDLTGGGEPLQNPHLLEMVRAAKDAGCEVGFSTNGVTLHPEVSEALVSLGLDWISFSVDAASEEVYERIRQGARFETVIGNITAMRAAKARQESRLPKMMMVFVMMTGAQQNYHQLPDYIQMAHSLGVEQVIAKNLDVIVKDGDDQRRLFSHQGPPGEEVEAAIASAQRRADELGIGLRVYALQPREQAICEQDPVHNIYFNWEGYVSPCITLSYAEKRFFDGERVLVPCQRFGDINTDRLEDIWDHPDYTSFRRVYQERLRLQQQAMVDVMLGNSGEGTISMPPAPEGCRTCYYLYGV